MIYIKLQNCCFFFFEVYLERGIPNMHTNQLKDVCDGVHFLTKLQAEGLQFYQKYASLQVFFKIFDQICPVGICKKFFKILRTSASQETF